MAQFFKETAGEHLPYLHTSLPFVSVLQFELEENEAGTGLVQGRHNPYLKLYAEILRGANTVVDSSEWSHTLP